MTLFLAVHKEKVSIAFLIELGFDIQAFWSFEFAGEVEAGRLGIRVHAEIGLGSDFDQESEIVAFSFFFIVVGAAGDGKSVAKEFLLEDGRLVHLQFL